MKFLFLRSAPLVLCLLLPFSTALAKRLVILPGDHHSKPAVMAVKQLRADPRLGDLEISVFANVSMGDREKACLRQADLVIMDLMTDQGFVAKIDEELRHLKSRGVMTLGLGDGISQHLEEYGVVRVPELAPYRAASDGANYLQLIRRALSLTLYPGLNYKEAATALSQGYYSVELDRCYERFESYRADYLASHPDSASKAWVGILFPANHARLGQTEVLVACTQALQRRGFNVLPAFGYPDAPAIAKLFLDESGCSRIEAMVALTLKMGMSPEKIIPVMQALDVPAINAINLYSQSLEEWEKSPVGLTQMERAWQVTVPEIAGAIAPTVIGSKEKVEDPDTGLEYASSRPIPERIERIADRVAAWVRLRQLRNSEKTVAVLYYNYPPGRDNVGAAYLNVLPDSLWEILGQLRKDQYHIEAAPSLKEDLFRQVRDYGSNGRLNNSEDLERLIKGGHAVLWPVAAYRKWFDLLPEPLRNTIIGKWGEPESTRTMVWKDPAGTPFFVFPVLRWGRIIFGPQPTRGWDLDINAAYHDLKLPPHHQYLAFYLWLQHECKVDAMVHVGTHATHEWQSGKELGFTNADPSEVLVGAVPQLYPYIVDNIGEGQQAKRRGMAAIITHMTPPLDKASVNPELREISGLINELHVALSKGAQASGEQRAQLTALAAKRGLLKDLSIMVPEGQALSMEQVEEVEHHIKRIGEKIVPFGLHTFGHSPEERWLAATAEAMLSIEKTLGEEDKAVRRTKYLNALRASAPAELQALSRGLQGRYISAGPGNDPIRNPEALPTGKNFYGFDPTRLPSKASYEAGRKLAEDVIARYRDAHQGEYPDRLLYNLWATETNRHEGIMEAQVLALLGVKPHWDERGRVDGVTVISRAELGRPRVDVTVTPTGLYRDSFPVLMLLIDNAVDVVRKLREADNPVYRNVAELKATLIAQGLSEKDAERVAAVRIFTEPPGVYGAGLETVVSADKSWTDETQVAAVYFKRLGHMFGQGFWGDTRAGGQTKQEVSQLAFRQALKGTKAVIHSRSSNVFATLDNDDVYQYLGGAAMAVRQVDGKSPEVLISDLSNPRSGETVQFERFIGQEMRSRYLNPKWVREMLDEGYAGARFIKQVTDNLWGWQVTVPEAIDGSKWEEMHEVYVKDRYKLDVRKKFEASGNLRAYQAMVDRMLVAVDKGYWKASPETVQSLRDASAIAAKDIAVEEAHEKAALAKLPLPDTKRLSQSAPAPVAAEKASVTAAKRPAGNAGAQTEAPEGSKAAAKPSSQESAPAESSVKRPAPASGSPSAARTVSGKVLEAATKTVSASSKSQTSHRRTLHILALIGVGLFSLGWARARWSVRGAG